MKSSSLSPAGSVSIAGRMLSLSCNSSSSAGSTNPALVRLNAVHQRLQALLRLAGNLVADAAHANPLHCSPPQAGGCCC